MSPRDLLGMRGECIAHSRLLAFCGNRLGPISSIPTTYPLDPDNLRRLWSEVRSYWQTLDPTAKNRTSHSRTRNMATKSNKYIVARAHALAVVFLTRRKDLEV